MDEFHSNSSMSFVDGGVVFKPRLPFLLLTNVITCVILPPAFFSDCQAFFCDSQAFPEQYFAMPYLTRII